MSKLFSDILHIAVLTQKNLYSTRKTHYEILKLSQNCTANQIKDAFIKLSKKYHPDVNQSKLAHSEFLRINEAYNVLSKTESRRYYDLGLTGDYRTKSRHYTNVYPGGPNPWSDPTFYHNRDRSQDKYYKNRPYYGIKGVNRMSNRTVAFLCIIFATIAVSLEILAIRHTLTFRREILLQKSAEAAEVLKRTVDEANANGNELQIERLKLKYAANDKQ